jgi:uncharacterized protein (TIGR02145 family)
LCEGFVEGTPREHYGQSKSQFCDERDGKRYVYVTIGTQTWMAENLNYVVEESKCYGEDGEVVIGQDADYKPIPTDPLLPAEVQTNCETYGRLYNWNMAMNNSASSNNNPSGVQGVCPAGWHLPSNAEWEVLAVYAGGASSGAGTKLKATSGWNDHETYGNGTDDYGFSGLPGGNFSGSFSGYFADVKTRGQFWSSRQDNNVNAIRRDLYYGSGNANQFASSKTSLHSVRCVKNEP